jgi:outer membrane protein assembly factor BamB
MSCFMLRSVLAVAFATAALVTAAADWDQWRGPARDGVADTFKVPSAWPDTLTQVWKQDVGIGHSSPVVASGRVFQHSRVAEEEVVRAHDLSSGKPIWEQRYPAPYTMNPAARQHGKGPKSTPLLSRGRIYTLGISGILSAFDAATGKVLWRHDFAKEFPQTSPLYGAAMSPIAISTGSAASADADAIVAHIGGPGRGALAAFDAASGAIKWAWRGDGPGYASPVVMTAVDGVRQIVTQTERRLVSLDARDGTLLWELPFSTEYDQNSITPIVRGDVVINSGLNQGTTAYRVSRAAGKWKAEQVWRTSDLSMYMSTPVLHLDVLFGLANRNRGQFFALDATNGKVLWTTEGRQGDNAALARAGDMLLALTTDGELTVFTPSKEGFKQVRQYTVASTPTWAHPALVAPGILIKDENTFSLWKY